MFQHRSVPLQAANTSRIPASSDAGGGRLLRSIAERNSAGVGPQFLQNLHFICATGGPESGVAILSADPALCVRLKMPNTIHFHRKRRIGGSICLDSTNRPAISTRPPRQTGTRITEDVHRSGLVRTELQAINKQIEQCCGVLFEAQEIATSRIDMTIDSDLMNLFCRFMTSVIRIPVEKACCSDSAELRYQSDRYSMIRFAVEFRALAVRHGGLNGYQGQ